MVRNTIDSRTVWYYTMNVPNGTQQNASLSQKVQHQYGGENVKKLEELRKARGLTQQELAHAVGVTYASIGRYERGERFPDIKIAARIAAALNCTVDDLIEKESA